VKQSAGRRSRELAKFCEECGNALMPDSRFCEECGTKVEEFDQDSKEISFSKQESEELFENSWWKKDWDSIASNSCDFEIGLILTREKSLLGQLNASSSQLRHLIKDYIRNSSERGVKYYYLNLDRFPLYNGDGCVDSVIKVLREVVAIARPKYLFILGNEKIIDVARWENNTEDGDPIVESDLCYSTLDVESPWDGQRYDFDKTIRVGRLPTYEGEDFDSFKSYFETATANIGRLDRIVPYGLSALVWEEESNYEFKKIAPRKVDVSPIVAHSTVSTRMGFESNLLFFNLHGSNRAKYWYGQDGGNYPTAFSPEALSDMDRPYFLGVEACYGARYLGGLKPGESILFTAMENKCLAFLGSSRIAFGTSTPNGSCADFVIGSYVENIKKGESAGDSHIAGLKRLTEDWDSMDDADIKTMAEFSLYGDPSARAVKNICSCNSKGFSSNIINRGLSVPMPDVGRAIRMSLVEVDAKIEAIIDDYVKCEILPELDGAIASGQVRMKTLRIGTTGLNQKIYSFSSGSIDKIAKVYFDSEGNIKKAIVSK
jgi:hypothetical protein